MKRQRCFWGIIKNASATAEAFYGEWFKTGDLGYLDKDGLLYITGRIKNLIILSKGKNESSEELESLLSQKKPEIKEVLVYGESDRITAEIYLDSEKKCDLHAVKIKIRTKCRAIEP